MQLEQFKDGLKDYAKDTRANLSSVLSPEGCPDLSEKQIFGIAVACAYSLKDPVLVEMMLSEAAAFIGDEEREAARAAATIMAMNNVYYRSLHLSDNKEIGKMPARLRMNVIGKPGIEKKDFELYSLAISALSGCGMCINAHVHEITKAGLTLGAVQSCFKIAAVLNSAATANFIG